MHDDDCRGTLLSAPTRRRQCWIYTPERFSRCSARTGTGQDEHANDSYGPNFESNVINVWYRHDAPLLTSSTDHRNNLATKNTLDQQFTMRENFDIFTVTSSTSTANSHRYLSMKCSSTSNSSDEPTGRFYSLRQYETTIDDDLHDPATVGGAIPRRTHHGPGPVKSTGVVG